MATTNDGRTVSIGGGTRVPYPEPADAAASKIGRANKRTGTSIEVRLRSALHRKGLRFRKDFLIRCSNGVRVHPDIVFTRARLVVFVDGCFWHRCPEHATTPKRNLEYWLPKLQANVDRDHRADAALKADGWTVVRVWEHEDVDDAERRVATAIEQACERKTGG